MRSVLAAALALALVGIAPPAAAADNRADRVVASVWTDSGYPLPLHPNYPTTHLRLYADGRLLTTGDLDAHGVITYRVARLSSHESRAVRGSLFRATHLVDFGFVPVADVGYTNSYVAFAGQRATVSINALGMDFSLTKAQRAARQRLLATIDRAEARASTLYAPEAFEVRRIAVDGPSIQLEWPGPELPAAACAEVPAAVYANFPDSYQQGSSYTWRAEAFTLWAKPLAPGESACPGT